MAALDDPHFVVRTTGADKLSTIDFEGGPFYAKALRDSSRFVRAAALSSLNSDEKTPDEAIDALIVLLPERQGPSAAEALGRAQRLFVQRAIPALRLGLAREDLDDRLTFAVALASLGDEQGFAALDDALRSEGTARTAASKIAELELDAARFVPRLIEMLDAGESFVISALGDIRDKRALPTLQSLADHRDRGLRVQAREAIKKIRGN